MKYIDMFEDLENLQCSKASKRKYTKIKEFLQRKKLAAQLDRLKVPNWYIELFINANQWNLHSEIKRKITYEQKINLFLKTLHEKIKTKNYGVLYLWKLKGYQYSAVTGFIASYTRSTYTEKEKEIIIKYREKYKKEKKESIFDGFFKNFINPNKHYKNLGLTIGANKKEIKKAYRTLSKKYHPDVGGNVEKFREIKNSYEILIKKGK